MLVTLDTTIVLNRGRIRVASRRDDRRDHVDGRMIGGKPSTAT